MFNLFKRVKTMLASEWNAALDKAEDPQKMLDQYMREMGEDIREAESAVAKQMANEKMLKKKYEDAEALVEKRERQAIKALEADNEDLARRTLADKKIQQETAKALKEAHERAVADVNELRLKLDDMKKEYQEMELKKDALKARAETAKTKVKINRTMSNIGNDASKQGFERMEEKVLRYEAEAETSEDLRFERKSLDHELEALEEDNGIEEELAALKEKLGKG